MIRKLSITIVGVLFVISFMSVLAEDIFLELIMPGDMFGPGSPFSLDLAVENTGHAYSDALLFVALTIGTGDFWFYPSWIMYPPNIDWEDIFVPAYASDQWVILPTFSWPHGSGSFEGAMFLAAIVHNGDLVSNLAETHFGWSEAPQPTPTPSATPEPSPTPGGTSPGDLHSVDAIVGNMRFVPEGTFVQGSPSDEPCRWSGEGPQFQHTLTRNLAVMEMGITRGMWENLKMMQTSLPDDPSSTFISPTKDHPVQRVRWYEAVLFANLLSIQNGLTPCYYLDDTFETVIDQTNYITDDVYCDFDANGYRLPTEGEREYFTRAGTSGAFSAIEPNYFEDNCWHCSPYPPFSVLDSIAWWCGNAEDTTQPVGTKLANPWNLYDLHGNLQEWCWDSLESYPTGPVTDYKGPTSDSNRLLRGGSWLFDAGGCRSAKRSSANPNIRINSIGFRLVRTVP